MKLKSIHIAEVPSYRPKPGGYEGKIDFYGESGSVSLTLTPDLCDKIFRICAESILNTAQEAATNLTCNILEHQKCLERNS